MASIVKANSNLTNGGIAVIRESINASDEGTIVFNVEYVCLAVYANRWIGRFRMKSTPPTVLPAALAVLTTRGVPTLYDVDIHTENGLTYFNAQYSSGMLSEVVVTETEEQRTCSGTALIQYTSQNGFGGTTRLNLARNVSFDYISKSVTVSAKNATLPKIDGGVGAIFNINVSGPGANSGTFMGARQRLIVTNQKTQSSRGEYTYSRTSTGIYELPAL